MSCKLAIRPTLPPSIEDIAQGSLRALARSVQQHRSIAQHVKEACNPAYKLGLK